MSKRKKLLDPRQKELDFSQKLEAYETLREEIHQTIAEGKESVKPIESCDEACVEIAAAVKRAIRKSNLSREQIVDAINAYFGGTAKPLSIHMFNHYLSKPAEYPLPAYLLFPIMRITGSLEPIQPFAEAEDARVITGGEERALALGKLDATITEMQRLKKEIKERFK